jgi:hypothetical protein
LFAAMAGMTALHSAHSAAGPLDLSHHSVITELGRLLLAHGYAGDAVPAALGTPPSSGKPHIRDDMPLYLRRLEQLRIVAHQRRRREGLVLVYFLLRGGVVRRKTALILATPLPC